MNPKIIPALINAFISFIIITPLSFFLNKLINHSTQTFMEYFNEKWIMLLGIVLIFALYNVFLKNRKFK